MERFALVQEGGADDEENDELVDNQVLNNKIQTMLEDLKKKLLKSQSKDQIDNRSEEYVKLIARAQSAMFRRALVKRISGVVLDIQTNQIEQITYYLRFGATLG